MKKPLEPYALKYLLHCRNNVFNFVLLKTYGELLVGYIKFHLSFLF